MDAAYCSPIIRAHREGLGHVPLIDHNPRGGSKLEFASHQARRFKERSTVERVNGRLKDGFGIFRVNVRGHAKVMTSDDVRGAGAAHLRATLAMGHLNRSDRPDTTLRTRSSRITRARRSEK